MAADVNILREFLVRIGFTIDDAQFKKMERNLDKVGEWLGELGAATGSVAYVVEKNVTHIAISFDHLYYQSQRIGSSVTNLQAFAFGASQIGVSSEEALSSVAGLNRAMRDNPGMSAMLNGMGIATQGRETTKVMDDLIDRLSTMQPFMRTRVAGMFGIDGDTAAALVRNHPAMKRYEADHLKRLAAAGFDPQSFASQSNDFAIQMRTLQDETDILRNVIARDWLPTIVHFVGTLDRVLNYLGSHHGVLEAAAGASALGSIGAGAAALHVGKGLLRRLLGQGGAAAAAGEGVAASEAGGGTLALTEGVGGAVAMGTGVGEVAVIVAAVAAVLGFSIYELHAHWSGVKTTAARAAGAVKGEAKFEAHETAKEVRTFVGMAAKGLDAFTQLWEGKRNNRYGDLAGYGTIGYGHKILAGEHFGAKISDADALALYRADMAKADKRVAMLTRGLQLNGGQRGALDDFEFNTGHLGGSTLLKMLKAGNLEGAARQFEQWDKVHINGRLESSKGLMNRRLGEEAMFRGSGAKIEMKTDIHVAGTSDPHGTARQVARNQGDAAAEMVRNVRGQGF